MLVSFAPILSLVTSPLLSKPLTATAPGTLPRPSAARSRTRRHRWGRRLLWSALLLGLAFGALVAHYNVSKALTAEDRHYIQLLLPGVAEGVARDLPYEAQVALVQRSQLALRNRAPSFAGIPEGQPREPKQFYLGRQGVCYDRSRVLEKMFVYLGLESRHVALFMREPGVSPFKTLLFHHVPSHAISEVRTARGWMLVDSNDLWLGLDQQRNPISVHQMVTRYEENKPMRWLTPVLANDLSLYARPCIYVYGLYSRHGRFFPPYTSNIPDYRVRGLLYNFEWVRNN